MFTIRRCRNVETGFEHLSVTFKKPGFDNLPDLIGRTEYGTSKSYAVDNPKYGIIISGSPSMASETLPYCSHQGCIPPKRLQTEGGSKSYRRFNYSIRGTLMNQEQTVLVHSD
ncbi:hypothetical protein, partial [Alistipes putredinis]|uniref:hypothetical protein n=1 Tax=Alistipes putredinis TaxID=28117 RepID=UPI003AB5E72C